MDLISCGTTTASCLMIPSMAPCPSAHARPSDCFMNALTRVGYIHEDIFADNFPPEQREEILREFVRLPGIYRAKIDASIMATFAEMRAERLERIAAITGIKGIVANYGRTHATTQENLSSLPNASAVIDNRWRNELQLSAVHHHSHRRWETRMDVASYPRIRRVQLRRRLKRVAARHTHPRRVWSRHSAYTKDQVAKGEKR